MIEIDEMKWGLCRCASSRWLLTDEGSAQMIPILMQLYAQMLGFA